MAGLLGFYYGETLCQVKSQSFKNRGALFKTSKAAEALAKPTHCLALGPTSPLGKEAFEMMMFFFRNYQSLLFRRYAAPSMPLTSLIYLHN
jgi:hypothetical protein